MKFTVRYAHLDEPSNLNLVDSVKRGDILGRMGNSGSSNASHLHIDLIKGYTKKVYRLNQIKFDRDTARQLDYFIDKELFDTEILITSYFCDPNYLDKDGGLILHPAYDVVPKNRKETLSNYDILWNRKFSGTVLTKGFDNGYGNYIHIGYVT